MTNYSHDKIVPFKGSGLGKKQQVAEMFDKIAFRYDFLNRFLSGGIDVYWRKRAIRELRGLPAGTVLDVATGTGDMAVLLARSFPQAHITGVDISAGMLEIGRQKLARLKLNDRITLRSGDSEALPFPDDQFDAITVAFGVRNFENLENGLREMKRVLKPGGKLVVLEFSQPRTPGISQLYKAYMRRVAPRIAGIASGNREAYQYLNDSVLAFPEGEQLIRILTGCGYAHTGLRRLSLGICSVYTAEKVNDGN
ncbi:MAG TPA: bifunctional demethylmenaquinone methyltransferase/2-methoxy-6-polyprenyl-1,4-benzoquinol methylase UbiE [Puia sp.]|jgi:demethylmenaquinone methyltransferase/2-methoxy-6-polyprenyl-1,4-benzoquinol methylase|nr:bifunctional demethylmenaquinone methyltransferase/2-methoxy-6-polyprenyl-1,4-benzoquinol methylase UbiE [Puia sp.]